jgi:ribosomal-protein-alanine N-acetyltransferase
MPGGTVERGPNEDCRMSIDTIIETKRTILRLFRDGDLAALCALHRDPNVMRFIGGGVRKTEDDVAIDLAGYVEHQDTHGYSRWAINCRADNAFVGRAGFLYLPDTDEIDLGYTLHRKYWGQGVASEIALALAAWARENLPIHKVIGMAAPANVASIRVLQKAGMTYVGDRVYRDMDVRLHRFESS